MKWLCWFKHKWREIHRLGQSNTFVLRRCERCGLHKNGWGTTWHDWEKEKHRFAGFDENGKRL